MKAEMMQPAASPGMIIEDNDGSRAAVSKETCFYTISIGIAFCKVLPF